MKDAVVKIQARIDGLTKEYEEQKANTTAPGNPYISALKGQIDGLQLALTYIRESIYAA